MTDHVTTDMRFALVPDWLLELPDLSHAAVRLYCILARYADTEGRAYPGRKLLASKLGVKSADTVDRALKELVAAGAVTVTKRYDSAGDPTSNLYLVHRTPPAGVAARMRPPTPPDAATGPQGCGDGSRTDAAQKKNHLKEEPPNPPQAEGDDATPSTGCARPGPTPHPNCRGCGTTNRQQANRQHRDDLEARRQADRAALDAQRAEKARIRQRGRSPDVDQLLTSTRRQLARSAQ